MSAYAHAVAAAYPWRVTMTKTFCGGNLRGLALRQQVRFATRAAAQAFADRVTAQEARLTTPCAGGSAYRLSDLRVERNT